MPIGWFTRVERLCRKRDRLFQNKDDLQKEGYLELAEELNKKIWDICQEIDKLYRENWVDKDA